MAAINKYWILLILLFGKVLSASENPAPAVLVQEFWQSPTSESFQASGLRLIQESGDVATLYRWLKSGPEYSSEISRGYKEEVRVAEDGTKFPYFVLIPEDYAPTRSYPVEFMLHGGVSRPVWESGGGWWRQGYESLQKHDRITVVPAAWNEAFWWHANQAENLPALLKQIKKEYNVDDNRVYLTGVSDGGTGAYFFAFKQPTEWAAFLPFIAHPAVLQNPASGGGYQLYFENLMAKPLYIVNGEEDPLYPVSAVMPFIEVLREAGIKHVFKAIEGGGHNTQWLPDEAPLIEQFKNDNPRDPFPDSLKWVSDSTERYNRYHWVVIDELETANQPGMVTVERQGNLIRVDTTYINAVTLLLNPEEIDFSQPVTVYVNGDIRMSEIIEQEASTLLKWAEKDLDKSMLVTAELNLRAAK